MRCINPKRHPKTNRRARAQRGSQTQHNSQTQRGSQTQRRVLSYALGLGVAAPVIASLLTLALAHDQEYDQNTALALTHTGVIIPLSDAVTRLHERPELRPFKLLEATLLHTVTPHPVYLLEFVDDDQFIKDLCIDASTAMILPFDICYVADNHPDAD